MREQIGTLNQQLTGPGAVDRPQEPQQNMRVIAQDQDSIYVENETGQIVKRPLAAAGETPTPADIEVSTPQRIREIAQTMPQSEDEANALLDELAAIDLEKAKLVRNQWERTKPWLDGKKKSQAPQMGWYPAGGTL